LRPLSPGSPTPSGHGRKRKVLAEPSLEDKSITAALFADRRRSRTATRTAGVCVARPSRGGGRGAGSRACQVPAVVARASPRAPACARRSSPDQGPAGTCRGVLHRFSARRVLGLRAHLVRARAAGRHGQARGRRGPRLRQRARSAHERRVRAEARLEVVEVGRGGGAARGGGLAHGELGQARGEPPRGGLRLRLAPDQGPAGTRRRVLELLLVSRLHGAQRRPEGAGGSP
jgi:hypothetical protein